MDDLKTLCTGYSMRKQSQLNECANGWMDGPPPPNNVAGVDALGFVNENLSIASDAVTLLMSDSQSLLSQQQPPFFFVCAQTTFEKSKSPPLASSRYFV